MGDGGDLGLQLTSEVRASRVRLREHAGVFDVAVVLKAGVPVLPCVYSLEK
jgi:hypothetical protein